MTKFEALVTKLDEVAAEAAKRYEALQAADEVVWSSKGAAKRRAKAAADKVSRYWAEAKDEAATLSREIGTLLGNEATNGKWGARLRDSYFLEWNLLRKAKTETNPEEVEWLVDRAQQTATQRAKLLAKLEAGTVK